MIDLFQPIGDEPRNLLPKDGEVYYHPAVFSPQEQAHYLKQLQEKIDWKNDEAVIYGKKHITKRLVAWYGSQAFSYTYSGIKKTALLWNEPLLALKQKVEEITGDSFNSCLLNLYHDGSEGMGWHSDAEKELIKNGAIASLSFGASRKFCFKHIHTKEKSEILLMGGSLLVMRGTTQSYWLHALPKMLSVKTPRINLTFRQIGTT